MVCTWHTDSYSFSWRRLTGHVGLVGLAKAGKEGRVCNKPVLRVTNELRKCAMNWEFRRHVNQFRLQCELRLKDIPRPGNDGHPRSPLCFLKFLIPSRM